MRRVFRPHGSIIVSGHSVECLQSQDGGPRAIARATQEAIAVQESMFGQSQAAPSRPTSKLSGRECPPHSPKLVDARGPSQTSTLSQLPWPSNSNPNGEQNRRENALAAQELRGIDGASG